MKVFESVAGPIIAWGRLVISLISVLVLCVALLKVLSLLVFPPEAKYTSLITICWIICTMWWMLYLVNWGLKLFYKEK